MILKMFTVFDQKAKAYLSPFCMAEKGQAIRSFTDLINDGDHQFSKHPEDYTLLFIGEYDDETAAIHPAPTLEALHKGPELVYTDPTGSGKIDSVEE